MSLPADFPRPTKHVFSPGYDGECLICGMDETFGPHVAPEPAFPDPDEITTPAGQWQDGDLLLVGGKVFEAVSCSGGLRFLPLGPVDRWGQGTVPAGAVLLVRDGVKVA